MACLAICQLGHCARACTSAPANARAARRHRPPRLGAPSAQRAAPAEEPGNRPLSLAAEREGLTWRWRSLRGVRRNRDSWRTRATIRNRTSRAREPWRDRAERKCRANPLPHLAKIPSTGRVHVRNHDLALGQRAVRGHRRQRATHRRTTQVHVQPAVPRPAVRPGNGDKLQLLPGL